MKNFFFFETNREDNDNQYSYYFTDPIEILALTEPSNLSKFFQKLEQYSEKNYYLAGFFSFELAYIIEKSLKSKLPAGNKFPLGLFFIYKNPLILKYPEKLNLNKFCNNYKVKKLKLNTNFYKYKRNFKKINAYIKNGDIFQVNYTLKYKFLFNGSPFSFYSDLKAKQHASYNCFLNFENIYILSISPELFFYRKDDYIKMKPMKGTIARGRNIDEDFKNQNFLKNDIKNRSENLMIVDLIRNDLGKICKFGTVQVKSLFEVEKYDTLFQMTSTIEGKLRENIKLYDIITSIFPSGSVTGAPKIRSIEIINELEKEPRNIYTGALGFVAPNKMAKFNVAIRTILIHNNFGEMGVGGGIVYDSIAEKEFKEVKLKANFLIMSKPQKFKIIETLLFYKDYKYLTEHLERMKRSALYFNFKFSEDAIMRKLNCLRKEFKKNLKYKIRILLSEDGEIELNSTRLKGKPEEYLLKVAKINTKSFDIFLYHKTTTRKLYDRELNKAHKKGIYDVIFLNERGELTEGAITNLYIKKYGKIYTPPIESGILPGIIRGKLISSGKVIEKKLYFKDLKEAEEIYISNSVIGFKKAKCII